MRRVLVALLPLLAFLWVPTPASAAELSVWIQNSADRPFTSTVRPSGAETSIALFAARNEFEAAQILVRSDASTTGVSVNTGALAGPGGATIPAANVSVRREYNHPRITKVGGDVQQPPDGGTAYYDALVDNTPQNLAANSTLAYFYQVRVPMGQAPGVYTGSATVRSAAGDVAVPVSVRVYDVTVPAANQSTFKMNNWFGSAGWNFTTTVQAILNQYNVQQFDANWWKVMENVAKNFAKHRNNVVFADFTGLLAPNTTVSTSGQFTFNWTTFDRFVQLFVDAGAMQYIYTPHVLENNDAPQLDTLAAINGVSGPVHRVLKAPDTPQTNSYLDQVFPALKAHLDAKGWTDQFYMSALDEPSSQPAQTASSWVYAKYRAHFPNPLTNEAHLHKFTANESLLSTLTPLSSTYSDNIGYYQSQRLAGKDLWLYTCIGPQDQHMNRFISYPLASTRLLPWLVWKIGGTGYLHWGWDYWWFDNNSKPDTFDGAHTGDDWLVRPNVAAYDIYDSLRSEAQLDGQEDYELLNLLKTAKPAAAKSISESLITDAKVYDRSGASAVQRHRHILEALAAAGPDGTFPFSEDFSRGHDNNWRHVQGNWSVSGGEYVQSDTSALWGLTSTVEGRSYGDVAVSADLRITGVAPSGGNSNWAGFMVRSLNATDMDSGYLVAQRNNGRIFIYRSGVTLAEAPAPGYAAGQWNRLRVVAKGGKIAVYSGTGQDPVLSVTDSSYPVGDIAVVTGGAAARFDNVRINPMTNPAEGAIVTASSSYQNDGWGTGSATDGRRGSVSGAMGWSSIDNLTANHTEWVRADLGSARPISRVDLYPRSDGANAGRGFPVDFTVQVSADGTDWTTVATKTGYPRPGAEAQTFPFPQVNARYIKVTGTSLSTDASGNYHMQLAEIEAAGGNLAAGRPFTSSSSVEYPEESWINSNATDGIHTSDLGYSMGWSSTGATTQHTEWARVDLGGPSRISKATLYARSDGANTGQGFPLDFVIEVSADGTNWTTVTTKTNYPRPGAEAQAFTFTPTTARYVRVTGTKLSAAGALYMMQLAELEVS
ncbi:discoidin domain-containing protein [Streptosporangium roseum]|uniref:discoidin domain-containing protein n=1 Tax=Streptosporangium roseum TaxID=2001 RepID=UPI00332F354F